MKKFYTLMLLASILTFGIANAQNRCVVNSSKNGGHAITFSNDMMVVSQSENHVSLVSKPDEPRNNFRGLNETHHLTINLPDNLEMMVIGDESGEFFDVAFGGDVLYETDLENGLYYLFANGGVDDGENFYHCAWTRDIVMSDDMEITIDFNECIYGVNIQAVNEFGTPLEECEFDEADYDLTLSYHNLMTAFESVYSDVFTPAVPIARYNGFPENCSLTVSLKLCPVGQTKDYLLYWTANGMDDNITLNCTQSDLSFRHETFSVNTPEGLDAIYNLDYKVISNGGWSLSSGWRADHVYKNESDYTVVSNAKVTDPNNPNFVMLMPTVFEWIDYENQGWPPYNNNIRAAFYFDTDGNGVKEAKPMFGDGLEANSNSLPNSPCKVLLDPNQVGHSGTRTPLGYFVPNAFSAEQNNGQAMLAGGLYFGGELGCERCGDGDAIISVNTAEGADLYYDSLYKYNYDAYFTFDDPSQIYIHVKNNHLVYNDVPMSNTVDVMIDYTKDDVMPPTMTFLRVNDAEGKESLELPDIEHSSLVFGCADYEWHYREDWMFYDYIIYGSKPNVELLYSVGEGEELLPLEFVENESLFNDNYGNVFVVDLAQLAGVVNDEWVNLTFNLTDEVGNVHKQELKNVFHVGNITSVAESNSLNHSVYPNPFSSKVRICANEAVNGNASISVFNVLGEQVYNYNMNCNGTTEFVIDGSNLNGGIYFYNIVTENGELKGRIVKE